MRGFQWSNTKGWQPSKSIFVIELQLFWEFEVHYRVPKKPGPR